MGKLIPRQTEAAGNGLPQQISCKHKLQIFFLKAGLAKRDLQRLFLQTALGILPGIGSEFIVIADLVKQLSHGAGRLLTPHDGTAADDVRFIYKLKTLFSQHFLSPSISSEFLQAICTPGRERLNKCTVTDRDSMPVILLLYTFCSLFVLFLPIYQSHSP